MLTKEEKARDARLRRLYGLTLVEYEQMVKVFQSGNCAICKRPPVNNRLAVDHDHKYKYVKIETLKNASQIAGQFWIARARYREQDFTSAADRRNDAVRTVRQMLKRASVRGGLCFPCNSGLRKYSDDPIRFLNAAAYLKRHQNKE